VSRRRHVSVFSVLTSKLFAATMGSSDNHLAHDQTGAAGSLNALQGDPMQLDVHFISSLPVKQLSACTAWGDKKLAQIVWAES
jgi:hypothetical protein